MAEESHDLNYKMSKKIAQLTKVIYQLNCRNEDNDSTIRNVAERYENEIADIMADARGKITTLRDQLNAQNDGQKLDIVVKELTARHQKEKEEALRQFDEYKATAVRNETNARQKFEERLMNASREVTTAKDQFTTALEQLKANQKKTAASGQADMDAFSARKEKEMDDLVKEYNERYKAMMAEQMDLQDKMERELNESWQTKLDSLRAEGGGLAAQLTAQLESERAISKSLREESANKSREIGDLRNALKDMESEIERRKQRELALNAGSSELSAEAERSAELISSLKNKVSHLEEELRSKDDTLRQREGELEQATASLGRQSSHITSLENEISVLKASVAALEGKLEEETQRRGQLSLSSDSQVKQLQQKLESCEGRLTSCQSQLATSQGTAAEATAALEALKLELTKLQQKYDRETADLKANHARELAAATNDASTSASTLLAKHKEELARLQSEMDSSRKAAMAEKEAALAALTTKNTEALAAQKSALEEKLRSQSEAADVRYDALRKERDQLAARLASDASSSEKEVSALQAQLEALLADSEAAKKAHAAELSRLKADHEAALRAALDDVTRSSQGQLTDVAQKHANELTALRRELDENKKAYTSASEAMRAEHEAFVQQLKQQHADELSANIRSLNSDTSARHDAEMARLRREMSEQLQSQRAAHEKTLNDRVAELNTQLANNSQAFAARIKALEDEIASLRDASSQSEASMGGQLKELRQQMEREAASHAAQMSSTIAQMNADAAKALETATAKHEAEAAALRSELAKVGQDHAAELARLGDDARSAQRDMEENYKGRIASLEKRKEEERAKQLSDMKSAYEAQIQQLSQSAASEAASLRVANGKLSTEVAALSSSLGVINKQLDDTAQRLTVTEDALKRTEAEVVTQGRQHVASLAEQKRAMEFERNQAIAATHAQHQTEAERAMAAFEAERQDFSGKIKQLKRHIADLEYKYANRESRAEDVDKINSLLRELREKDDALLKAFNDMKFYKLELVNREESYNKVFGRQPTVASAADAATKPVAPSSAPPGKTFADGPRTRAAKSLK